ncbi:hypothetical protein BCV71DRAFT_231718 [Rhizopus microsporus]|uniref:Uncharacterized protein n=1 Tax=Rhizopus microsporus TaxID=58291 RepID=A0A1X0SCJ5_RHIZD|nr:hypothetical protein BCV71DRAFT_231718 [Rhizopus microsporus]
MSFMIAVDYLSLGMVAKAIHITNECIGRPARVTPGELNYEITNHNKNAFFSKDSSNLDEEHRGLLVELIDKKPALVLDQVMDDLKSDFMGLEVSKAALYDFTREKCRIGLKKAHFHSVNPNLPENLEKRHSWENRWQQTDMDI